MSRIFHPLEADPGARSRGPRASVRGRGAASQPANRFAARSGGEIAIDFRYEPLEVEEWGDDWGPGDPWGPGDHGGAGRGGAVGPSPGTAGAPAAERTVYVRDATRTILARNDSPDIPFDASVNPYRGCEHGCAYCYARPTHEYLGLSAGLDFERRILVKTDAAPLLRTALGRRGWRPQVIAMSGVTDPYQPIERRLAITRSCLEVLLDFRNPVSIVTKSHLVARDIDLLRALSEHRAASVALSITSLDARLARALEPRAPGPAQRLHAIHQLAAAGIPVGVMVAPVIPGLTDAETPAILRAAAEAGAGFAGTVPLRLPHGVDALFADWLERHAPERKVKVLDRLKSLRREPGAGGGASERLNDPAFGSRMRGHGPYAQQLHDLFHLTRRRVGLARQAPWLSTAAFRRPEPVPAQLTLF
ncbi:MAG: PA0069 family radical SAM protein [Planctomycetota bacterium]|nr:PA0069 family radical SAM protein [Planctomycetota bacterium]